MASVLGWPPQVPLVPPDEETGPPVESTADPQPEEPEISSASSISAGSTCEPTLVSVSQPPVQVPDEAPEPGNPADAAAVEEEETRPPVEIAVLQPEESEHQYGSSRSPYQRLAPSLEEFKELQANMYAVQAEVSAEPAREPQPYPSPSPNPRSNPNPYPCPRPSPRPVTLASALTLTLIRWLPSGSCARRVTKSCKRMSLH